MALTVAELEGKISLEASKVEAGQKVVDQSMRRVTASMLKAEAAAQKLQDQFDRAQTARWNKKLKELDDQLAANEKASRKAAAEALKVQDAHDKAAKGSRDYGDALGRIPGPLGDVASATSRYLRLLTGPGGLVVGLAAAATGAVLLTKAMGDEIERLDNLSRQTGLSVAALQAFEHAARQAGEAPESLAMGFAKVNMAISDLIAGKDAAAKGFEAIGVPFTKMVKDGAGVEQILEATAKALAAIPDPTARAAAQMDLFGLRGRAMSTVLDALAKDGIAGYKQALIEAGVITSEQTNEMARAFDRFFDRVNEARVRWQNEFKAAVATMALGIIADLKILQEQGLLFGDALRQARADMIAQMTAPERAPGFQGAEGGPRTLAQTPEQKAAADKAIKDALELVSAMRLLNKEWEEGAKLGDQYATILAKMEFDRLDAEAKQAEASLRDYDLSLTVTRDDLLETNRVIDANVGAFQESGETLGFAASMAKEATLQLQGLPPSILAVLDASDQTFIRFRDLVEGADGSVERLARQIKTELPSALQAFAAGFEATSAQITEHFTNWSVLGSQTAQDLHTAFSDSFFLIMKGDLDDLDDVWKSFFNAVLRHIADFLAAEAVKDFLNFVKDLRDLGGDDEDLFQQPRGTRTLAQSMALQEERGRAIGRTAGGLIGGAGGAASGVPFGGLIGAAIGREVFGWLGDIVGDFIAGLLGVGEAARAAAQAAGFATTSFNTASRQSVEAFDLTTTSLEALGVTLDPGLVEAAKAADEATTDAIEGMNNVADSLGDLGKAAQDADIATTAAIAGINDARNSIAPAPGTPGGGPQPSFWAGRGLHRGRARRSGRPDRPEHRGGRHGPRGGPGRGGRRRW